MKVFSEKEYTQNSCAVFTVWSKKFCKTFDEYSQNTIKELSKCDNVHEYISPNTRVKYFTLCKPDMYTDCIVKNDTVIRPRWAFSNLDELKKYIITMPWYTNGMLPGPYMAWNKTNWTLKGYNLTDTFVCNVHTDVENITRVEHLCTQDLAAFIKMQYKRDIKRVYGWSKSEHIAYLCELSYDKCPTTDTYHPSGGYKQYVSINDKRAILWCECAHEPIHTNISVHILVDIITKLSPLTNDDTITADTIGSDNTKWIFSKILQYAKFFDDPQSIQFTLYSGAVVGIGNSSRHVADATGYMAWSLNTGQALITMPMGTADLAEIFQGDDLRMLDLPTAIQSVFQPDADDLDYVKSIIGNKQATLTISGLNIVHQDKRCKRVVNPFGYKQIWNNGTATEYTMRGDRRLMGIFTKSLLLVGLDKIANLICAPETQTDMLNQKNEDAAMYKHLWATKQSSNGERTCRYVLESLFGVPFINSRPDILKNPKTGKNLELDCYNKTLKLALEFNGEYHYKSDQFHNTKHIEYRDALKKQLCIKHGIHLIVVPYTVKNIKEYILQNLPDAFLQQMV